MDETGDVNDITRPNAIWLGGVDNLSTKEVKKYIKNFTDEHFTVEWINDTSVNVAFEDNDHASTVLRSITKNQDNIPDEVIEREVQSFDESNKDVVSRARLSKIGDKKVKNARIYSRYYLLNPKAEKEAQVRRRGDYRDRESRSFRSRIEGDGDLFPDKISSSGSRNVQDSDVLYDERSDEYNDDLLSGIRGEGNDSESSGDRIGANDSKSLFERIGEKQKGSNTKKGSGKKSNSLLDRIG